jgi:hypothetical protein
MRTLFGQKGQEISSKNSEKTTLGLNGAQGGHKLILQANLLLI